MKTLVGKDGKVYIAAEDVLAMLEVQRVAWQRKADAAKDTEGMSDRLAAFVDGQYDIAFRAAKRLAYCKMDIKRSVLYAAKSESIRSAVALNERKK